MRKIENTYLPTWLGLINFFDNRENLPLQKMYRKVFFVCGFLIEEVPDSL